MIKAFFLGKLIERRYKIYTPEDPKHRRMIWVSSQDTLKDSTIDILNSIAPFFIHLERESILIMKDAFRCPNCNLEFNIDQPRDNIQISCKKCNDRFEFMHGSIVHWEGNSGKNILTVYPDERRGWH